MRTGTPPSAASEKLIAMRWSSYVSITAVCNFPGDIRSESRPSSTRAPSLRSSVAIAASRSVSFTRQLPMLRSVLGPSANSAITAAVIAASGMWRSEEHTFELQSLAYLVCRLLLEKKKKTKNIQLDSHKYQLDSIKHRNPLPVLGKNA